MVTGHALQAALDTYRHHASFSVKSPPHEHDGRLTFPLYILWNINITFDIFTRQLTPARVWKSARAIILDRESSDNIATAREPFERFTSDDMAGADIIISLHDRWHVEMLITSCKNHCLHSLLPSFFFCASQEHIHMPISAAFFSGARYIE